MSGMVISGATTASQKSRPVKVDDAKVSSRFLTCLSRCRSDDSCTQRQVQKMIKQCVLSSRRSLSRRLTVLLPLPASSSVLKLSTSSLAGASSLCVSTTPCVFLTDREQAFGLSLSSQDDTPINYEPPLFRCGISPSFILLTSS